MRACAGADGCGKPHIGDGTLQGQDLGLELNVIVMTFLCHCFGLSVSRLCSHRMQTVLLTLADDRSLRDFGPRDSAYEIFHWNRLADVDHKPEFLKGRNNVSSSLL